jgi:hypothetical protein
VGGVQKDSASCRAPPACCDGQIDGCPDAELTILEAAHRVVLQGYRLSRSEHIVYFFRDCRDLSDQPALWPKLNGHHAMRIYCKKLVGSKYGLLSLMELAEFVGQHLSAGVLAEQPCQQPVESGRLKAVLILASLA